MASTSKLPRSIYYIVGNEAAERFSFYGMKAILTTFLVSQFFNPGGAPALEAQAAAKANDITHFFNTLVYFLPLVGAVVADWFWGKYRVILYLSLVYCAGNACLAIFQDNLNGFLFGLLLIAVGAGGIKPCVSANVGDQIDPADESLRSKAFSWFYFSINVGAFISMLLTPLVMQYASPMVAFGVPGVLMALATLVFFLGRNSYVRVPPSGVNRANFMSINAFAALQYFRGQRSKTGWLDAAKTRYAPERVDAVKSVWRILAFFAMVPAFWALNDQNSSEWVLQAKKMDLHFLGHTWLAEQVQSVNSILVLVYIPLYSYVVFPWLEKRGVRLSPYRKVGVGFLLTILSFVIIYLIQVQIDQGQSPSIGWQVLAYVILTAAEVLIYQTGLEYAYTQAPESMKSTIMSFWLLTISLGNYIVSAINGSIAAGGVFSGLTGANYYLFFIGLMAAATVVFGAMMWRRKTPA